MLNQMALCRSSSSSLHSRSSTLHSSKEVSIAAVAFESSVFTSASCRTASTKAGVSAVVDNVSKVPLGLIANFDGMLDTKEEKLCVRTFCNKVRGMILSKASKLAGGVGPSWKKRTRVVGPNSDPLTVVIIWLLGSVFSS